MTQLEKPGNKTLILYMNFTSLPNNVLIQTSHGILLSCSLLQPGTVPQFVFLFHDVSTFEEYQSVNSAECPLIWVRLLFSYD